MNEINRVLSIAMLIVMTSCEKAQVPDTAVLSERTHKMVDYFLNENKAWLSNWNQLIIEGYIEDNRNCFYLHIFENDTSIFKPYGKYNGIVHYKGYDILLFGDSWNEFLWSCDTICDIPDMNNQEICGWFYDPTEWNICIRCSDTIIIEAYSSFPNNSSSSLSYGEYSKILCDSLIKIIRQ